MSSYLASLAATAVVRCVAGVTACRCAPWDPVSTTGSGHGPVEQPRTTMALGKCLQKMGFTCLRVSRLRQKSCRVWTPFPHEVEHCKGRSPQAFINMFQLVFIHEFIYWLRHNGGEVEEEADHWCCFVSCSFSALVSSAIRRSTSQGIFQTRSLNCRTTS